LARSAEIAGPHRASVSTDYCAGTICRQELDARSAIKSRSASFSIPFRVTGLHFDTLKADGFVGSWAPSFACCKYWVFLAGTWARSSFDVTRANCRWVRPTDLVEVGTHVGDVKPAFIRRWPSFIVFFHADPGEYWPPVATLEVNKKARWAGTGGLVFALGNAVIRTFTTAQALSSAPVDVRKRLHVLLWPPQSASTWACGVCSKRVNFPERLVRK